MQKGYLIFELKKDNGVTPVSNAQVKLINIDGREVNRLLSVNENGKTNEFEIYTKNSDLTFNRSNNEIPYTKVDAEVKFENDKIIYVDDIQVYPNTTSIQEIKLDSRESNYRGHKDKKNKLKKEHIHLKNESPCVFKENENEQYSFLKEDNIIKPIIKNGDVYIPEFITVHIGGLNEKGEVLSIPFIDYIKNVCCSSIYPTWREEAIKANVYAITSFTLNRIYTDWYRSKGYGFEITSDSKIDQMYVKGRTLFRNICDIVDENFNKCIKIEGFKQPLLAKCCNKINGERELSRWGSLDLAEEGLDALEILKKYYGDNIRIVDINNINGIIKPISNKQLTIGSQGNDVKFIQKALNLIGKKYLGITPILKEDGKFGSRTQIAVKDFQNIFNLKPDGIVGNKTWNKISLVYALTKKIDNLDDELEEISFNSLPLKLGDKGYAVEDIQESLNEIFESYPMYKKIKEDGYYGEETKKAVEKFQRRFGLVVDGIVGRATIDRIEYVLENIENLEDFIEDRITHLREKENKEIRTIINEKLIKPLKLGDEGSIVRKIQESLNDIFKPFKFIEKLIEDGEFGEKTKKAVEFFQRKFGLIVDGIVGSNTFERIKYILKNIDNLIDFIKIQLTNDKNEMKFGDQGDNVKKIQEYLNIINKTYNMFAKLIEDGYFGEKTKEAVEKFQREFNLFIDGIVGEETLDKIKYILNNLSKLDNYIENQMEIENNIRAITDQQQIIVPIKIGDTGENVKKLQKALNNLSVYYGFLGNILEDGIYGSNTENSVCKFQKKFGIPVDGIFGEMSLNKLNSLNKALEELKLDETIFKFKLDNNKIVRNKTNFKDMIFKSEYSMRYPNINIEFGCTNGYVTLAQKYLNLLKENYRYWFSNKEELLEDGKFGRKTLNDINDFQKEFNFNKSEKIDEDTWNKLVIEYEKVYF